MAGRFPPAWLDELRARADIVQVVSAYVPLKQNGHRYWGLCPFHNEKTASFSVDGQRQLYYCFGCKAGGSVIQFVMDIDRLDFADAVKQLAEQVHLPLPEMRDDPDYEKKRTQKERLYELNKSAAQFYHQLLWQPEGKEVLDYFHARGLTDGVIRRFGLGASPTGWDTLTANLLREGFTLDELRTAGLTVVKEDRRFDMFRHRAMFPIIDPRGRILGFGGRVMDKSQPKYLNTADTPIFNKRYMVYAANLLQKAKGLKRVILVEGYMDVVSLTQFGVEGVCATLGTALTPDQARLLKRYAPEVWVSYDGDSAGQHAILRALDIMEEEGIPCRVLDFPDKLDPDEFIRRDGAAAFEGLVPLKPVSYRMLRAQEQFDLATQDGRTEYAKACAVFLSKVDSPVDLENYLTELTLQTGFSREVLMAQIDTTAFRAKPAQAAPQPQKKAYQPNASFDRTQAMLLSILSTGHLPQGTVAEDDFEDDFMRALAARFLKGESAAQVLEAQEDEQGKAVVSQILASRADMQEDQLLSMAEDCIRKIRAARLEKRMKALMEQVSALTGADKVNALKEWGKLEAQLKELKK